MNVMNLHCIIDLFHTSHLGKHRCVSNICAFQNVCREKKNNLFEREDFSRHLCLNEEMEFIPICVLYRCLQIPIKFGANSTSMVDETYRYRIVMIGLNMHPCRTKPCVHKLLNFSFTQGPNYKTGPKSHINACSMCGNIVPLSMEPRRRFLHYPSLVWPGFE